MKIVLNEGVPEGLAKHLSDHDVHSVGSLGSKGAKNGRLLGLIESVAARAFITADKSLQKQQNLTGRPFATLLLSTNSWPLIERHTDEIKAAVEGAEVGTVTNVECGRFIPRRFRNQPDRMP